MSMKPLCIDCDGTLLRTDLLHESLVRVLLRKPWMIFSCLLWLTRGRAYMKERLGQMADIDAGFLADNVVCFSADSMLTVRAANRIPQIGKA